MGDETGGKVIDLMAALKASLAKTTTVEVGLRAQGHMPRVMAMLEEGASWEQIGQAIGWDPDTAREWFERERGGSHA